MKQTSSILAMASLLSLANAHGYITTPSPRMPGSAMAAACGQQVYNNQASDHAGNVQGELQVASSQSDYDAAACDIWLCKGYKFDDNTENVQSYTAGQVVDIVVNIVAPHTGVANVSVVDTASNTVIGSPLINWDEGYASTATGVTEDETNFSITIPEDLGSACAEAGACVLQWYWFAEDIDQTYESCVDFTVGEGSGETPSDPSTSSSTEVATSTTTSVSSTVPATSTTTSFTTTTEATTTSSPTRAPTFSTSVRPTTTEVTTPTETATVPSTPTGTEIAIPVDGTTEEQLNWVASLLKALLAYE
ncbi:chitin binding domain-containing protein [Aspergillus crustosus]